MPWSSSWAGAAVVGALGLLSVSMPPAPQGPATPATAGLTPAAATTQAAVAPPEASAPAAQAAVAPAPTGAAPAAATLVAQAPAAPPASPAPAAPSVTLSAPPPAPPPTPVPLEEAVLRAANDLFSKAQLPADAKPVVVIDPLIGGVTGAQTVATRAMERRIAEIVRANHPRFQLKPFTAEEVAKGPVVLVGTFTPINNAGQAAGPKDAYRVCLTLADLGGRKIVGKGVARAIIDGVDNAPTPTFAETPVFAKDPAIDAYVKACQGTRLGDTIEAAYTDRILAAALIADAIRAYDESRYRDSLDLYQAALRTPGGDQLRVHNGLYLSNWKLGRRAAAAEAFGKVVEKGLAGDRLAVKFLFRPGSTLFVSERRLSQPYPIWLKEIGSRVGKGESCLELVGHTSPTGPAALNQRLSVLRAEQVRDRLIDAAPALGRRSVASGVGSRENLVGTGADDASDALDRRVEFKVLPNCNGQPTARAT